MLSEKKHRKRLITGNPISKRQFEKKAGASENDPRFTEFFNQLIKEGIILKLNGKYLIEPEKAFKKIIECDLGGKAYQVFRERYLWGLK